MENCGFLAFSNTHTHTVPTRVHVKILFGEEADTALLHTPKVFHNNHNSELVICYLPLTQLIKTYLSPHFLNNEVLQLGTEEETEAFKGQVSTPFVSFTVGRQ